MTDRPRALHPFLLATFPVLYLYAANVQEGVTFQDVAPVLVVVLGATGLAMLLARWAFRDVLRAGIAVSGLLLLFFSYGHVRSAIGGVEIGGISLDRHRFLLAVWAVLAVAAVVVAARLRGPLPAVTRGLNVVGSVLVLLNLVSVAVFEVRTSGPVRASGIAEVTLQRPASGRAPDIYYIVLDRYGGQQSLQEVIGFDNSEFLGFLADQGFVIAPDSRANYPRTNFSLASSLNFEHLGFLTDNSSSDDTGPLISLISDHRVGRALKAAGYRYVHIGSWWGPTARNARADFNVDYGGLPEFPSVLLQTTPVWPVADFTLGRRRDWEGVQRQFEVLIQSRAVRGPKFVFAHVISPHEPFVFDRHGNFVSEEEAARRPKKQRYLEQLLYVNSRIQEVVEALLAGPDDPVIVIQGDEGPYEGPGEWGRAPNRVLRRKFSILNAYYLPGQGEQTPYPGITPVNTFRLVFARYFGAELPFLPDRSYVYADLEHLYEFVDVTDRVAGESPAPSAP